MKEKIKQNNVYNMDCYEGLKLLKDDSINLIYLDPPFFSQRKHTLKNKEGKEYSFEDTWKNLDEYLDFLEIRFVEMKRVLKDSGSIFVHCDKTASHNIRIILDKVFGATMFRSEIIWTFRRWSNSKKGLLDAHQNIYFYSKSKNYKFNFEYTKYSVTTNIDQIYQDRIRNSDGKTVYKIDENGNSVSTKEKKGVPISDVWEIPYLNPKAKERTGYPTQKPIILLEKIIRLVTDESDVVLDPFCGSGTTLVASKELKRNFIGFDVNYEACELSKNRIVEMIKTESQLLKKGKQSYENKSEMVAGILKAFDCDIVQRNKGLDAILRKKYNQSLVGIKVQNENETLFEAGKLLESAMEKRKFKTSILIRTHLDLLDVPLNNKLNIVIMDSILYQKDKFFTDNNKEEMNKQAKYSGYIPTSYKESW